MDEENKAECPECGNTSELTNKYEATNNIGRYVVMEYFCDKCLRVFAVNKLAGKSDGGEYFRK